jgi:type IV secretory pathway VirB4 component
VLATQSLADIASSPLCAVILESCPTRLYLPNAEARSPQNAALYRSFGLADAQIEVIAAATPKRDYYYVSPRGRRLFSLALTPAALAFVGAGSPEDIIAARQMHQRQGDHWAAEWLRHKGLPEWAEYWERIATEMASAAGDTHRPEATLPRDQRFREEVVWAED